MRRALGNSTASSGWLLRAYVVTSPAATGLVTASGQDIASASAASPNGKTRIVEASLESSGVLRRAEPGTP